MLITFSQFLDSIELPRQLVLFGQNDFIVSRVKRMYSQKYALNEYSEDQFISVLTGANDLRNIFLLETSYFDYDHLFTTDQNFILRSDNVQIVSDKHVYVDIREFKKKDYINYVTHYSIQNNLVLTPQQAFVLLEKNNFDLNLCESDVFLLKSEYTSCTDQQMYACLSFQPRKRNVLWGCIETGTFGDQIIDEFMYNELDSHLDLCIKYSSLKTKGTPLAEICDTLGVLEHKVMDLDNSLKKVPISNIMLIKSKAKSFINKPAIKLGALCQK